MLQLKFKIETKEFSDKLDLIKDKKRIDFAVKKALSKIALLIRKKVIPKTPRDMGDLMNSWKVEDKYLSLEIGYNIVYAMYQHQGMRADGTHKIRNRPAGGETYFLKNTINENQKKAIEIFEETVFEYLLT